MPGTTRNYLFDTRLNDPVGALLRKEWEKCIRKECDVFVTKMSAEDLLLFEGNAVMILSAKYSRRVCALLRERNSAFYTFKKYMLAPQLEHKYIQQWIKNHFKYSVDSPTITAHRNTMAPQIAAIVEARNKEKAKREEEKQQRGLKRVAEEYKQLADTKSKQHRAEIAHHKTVIQAAKEVEEKLTPLVKESAELRETARKANTAASRFLAHEAPSSSDEDDGDDIRHVALPSVATPHAPPRDGASDEESAEKAAMGITTN